MHASTAVPSATAGERGLQAQLVEEAAQELPQVGFPGAQLVKPVSTPPSCRVHGPLYSDSSSLSCRECGCSSMSVCMDALLLCCPLLTVHSKTTN